MRNRLALFPFAVALALGGACGSGSPTPHGGPIAGLKSIVVTPANATLTVTGMMVATLGYTATATFSDGHSADVTNQVVFTVGDPQLGAFAGAAFTSGTDHGGATTIIASAGMIQGTTGLTLRMKQSVTDPGSTMLPPNPDTKFGGPAGGSAPELVYPNDGVLVPPNLGKLEFHFKPGGGNTIFELAFENGPTDVKVYLGCTNPTNGGCIYQPDAKVWHWIAESNRGASPLMVTLRGTDDQGTAVGTSTPLSVSFSADNIEGGLYYWKIAQNGDTAIMRFDFASATQTMGTQFIGTQLTGGTCVGCHALSRDGGKMVAEAGGMNDGRILLMDVARTLPLVPFASTPKSFFESWNPGGTQFVGVDNSGNDFNLRFFDGTSGAFLSNVAGTGDATNPADHPDWSPDGSQIAYVKVGIANTLQQFYKGAIEVVKQSGGAWSAPVEVIPAVDGKNHYYPAFSPDGSFLVYNESTCSMRNNSNDCNADTNPSAKLLAVLPTAGASPVALTAANAGGKLDGGQTDLTSSFPKWSPFVFKRSASEMTTRLEWLTFASKRAFGLRTLPQSNRGGNGTLLWMAAVDPNLVAQGKDPSSPAFVLPFQDLTTSNHIAQWTTKVVPPIQ